MTEFSPAWAAGRGPLAFLPALLFGHRRPLLVLLVGWLVALAGSVVLGFAVARLAGTGAGPDLGGASPLVQFFGIALLSPVLETLLMAGWLGLLARWLPAWGAALVSAVTWGVLHSLLAPWWGVVVWWPFLIFSVVWLTWRPLGRGAAFVMAAAVHVLQNTGPALLLLIG